MSKSLVYEHLQYSCAIADQSVNIHLCLANVVDRTHGPSNCLQRQCSRPSRTRYCWQHARSPHTREYVPLTFERTFPDRIRETLADDVVRRFKRDNRALGLDYFTVDQLDTLRAISRLQVSEDINKILSVLFMDNPDRITTLNRLASALPPLGTQIKYHG